MRTITVDQLKNLESEGIAPVTLLDAGNPRDAFELGSNVPFWHSGKGEYECLHANIRKGTKIAFTGLADLKAKNLEELKSILAEADLYPTGGTNADKRSGANGIRYTDYSARPLHEYQQWFDKCSKVTNLQPQQPLDNLRKLTPDCLGELTGEPMNVLNYGKLVNYLADNMRLFFDKDGADKKLLISNRGQRLAIVESLLNGLRNSVRYTRIDKGTSKAYLFNEEMMIEGLGIVVGPQTYAVIRPNGEISPLSVTMVRNPAENKPDTTYVRVSPPEVTGKVDVATLVAARGTLKTGANGQQPRPA